MHASVCVYGCLNFTWTLYIKWFLRCRPKHLFEAGGRNAGCLRVTAILSWPCKLIEYMIFKLYEAVMAGLTCRPEIDGLIFESEAIRSVWVDM